MKFKKQAKQQQDCHSKSLLVQLATAVWHCPYSHWTIWECDSPSNGSTGLMPCPASARMRRWCLVVITSAL